MNQEKTDGKVEELNQNQSHQSQTNGKVEAEAQPEQERDQRRWERIRGTAKQLWSKLTDDDFKEAGGSVDKLYLLIQAKFGDTPKAIRVKINNLLVRDRKEASKPPSPTEANTHISKNT